MQRVLFVDVLRLLALFQMINGHTLDALLADSVRAGEGFETYRFIRGLTSVAFMVLAGLSFHLTTLSRFEHHLGDPAAVRRRLWRACEIVLVGFALQLHPPGDYLDPTLREQALRGTFRCEVLQCIGLGLLMLEFGTLVARKARHVVLGSAVAAAVMFALAPAGEALSHVHSAGLWQSVVGHGQGSQFPLFPWSGFVFAGVVLGAVALPERGFTPLSRRLLALGGAGVLLFAGAYALRAVGPGHMPGVHPSSVPWFALKKLAVISLILAALALATFRMKRLPRTLSILGGETLAIFVFHLQVIYGGSLALAAHFARSLTFGQALLASAFNISLSIAFGLGWHALKEKWRAHNEARASRSDSQLACSARSSA